MSKRQRDGQYPALSRLQNELLKRLPNTSSARDIHTDKEEDDSAGPPLDETPAEYVARMEREREEREEEKEIKELARFYERELRSGVSSFQEVVQAIIELHEEAAAAYEAAAAAYERILLRKARELAEKEVKRLRALKAEEEAERKRAAEAQRKREEEIRQARPSVSPPRQLYPL